MSNPYEPLDPNRGQYAPEYQGGSVESTFAPTNPVAKSETDRLAIVGLVLAFLFWPAGLVVSIVSLSRTGPGQRRGRGLAVAGTVISALGGLFWVLLIAAVVAAGPSDSTEVGADNSRSDSDRAAELALAEAEASEAAEAEAEADAAAEEVAAAEKAAEEAAAQRAAEEAAAEEAAEKAAAEQAAAEAAAVAAAAEAAAKAAKYGQQPADQQTVVALAAAAQEGWSKVENDLQRGALKAERDTGICAALPGRKVENWTGVLRTIDANGDGKGVLAIEIADDVQVKTWNNAFSDFMDDTLIDPSSPVFAAALTKSVGDVVTFSGDFVEGTGTDCLGESSLSLRGAVTSPEFIFRFSSLS